MAKVKASGPPRPFNVAQPRKRDRHCVHLFPGSRLRASFQELLRLTPEAARMPLSSFGTSTVGSLLWDGKASGSREMQPEPHSDLGWTRIPRIYTGAYIPIWKSFRTNFFVEEQQKQRDTDVTNVPYVANGKFDRRSHTLLCKPTNCQKK